MGNTLENLGVMLGEVVQRMCYLKGVNLIKGEYNGLDKMEGVDDNMNNLVLGTPTLKFDERDMEGFPIHLYFYVAGDAIKMHYEFNVKTCEHILDKAPDAVPMLITNLSLEMVIKDDCARIATKEKLRYNMLSLRPQVASGERTWNSLDEFFEIKRAFEEDRVEFCWGAIAQWVNVSSKEMQENLKKPDYKPESQNVKFSGRIPVRNVLSNTNLYKSMFGQVSDLLHWEYETMEGGNGVYFMDPFKDDALYFLPQEFRIRALSNNAPDMTTEIVSENGGHKILMHFGIAPYVHPNAKRDLYKIFYSRKKKKYCEIRYGGYESAEFDTSHGELADGNLYGANGFKLITNNKDIKATPESSFDIVFEVPSDGLVCTFQENIMMNDDVGIHIGDVFFTVVEGLDKKEKKLGPIPVRMNLHKLASLQPHVSITECKWPNYTAKITNTGLYPIEIGGVALSVLRREKNQVKDVKHELKCGTSLPQTLARGESMIVKLSDDQVQKIKHRRFPLFWKIREDYWTEFICEPYHIRLHDEDLKEILEKTNESAAYEYQEWTVSVTTNFDWYDYPDLLAVQVEVKNNFGVNKVVTLKENEESNISMDSNLNARMKTQQAGERNFEYRVRAIVKNGPQNPTWSEWESYFGDVLFISNQYINIV